MSFSSSPLALIGAIIAAGLCVFLAFQAAALMLPFVMSNPLRWILAPIAILTFVGGFWRARKKRKALQHH